MKYPASCRQTPDTRMEANVVYTVCSDRSSITLGPDPEKAARKLLKRGFTRDSVAPFSRHPVPVGGVLKKGTKWELLGGDPDDVLVKMAVLTVRDSLRNIPAAPLLSPEQLVGLPEDPRWRRVLAPRGFAWQGLDEEPELDLVSVLVPDGWMTGLSRPTPNPARPKPPDLQGAGSAMNLTSALDALTDNRYTAAVDNWWKPGIALIPALTRAVWVSGAYKADSVGGVTRVIAMWVPVFYSNTGHGVGGPALETAVLYHA